MPNGGTQPNKRPLSREEYEHRIAGDIVGRRVEAPKPETSPTPPPEETVEEEPEEEIIEGEPEGEEEKRKPELSREDIERLAREQRAEVPKYEAKLPEEEPLRPGGAAIKPKKPGLAQRGGQAVKRGASRAGQAVKTGTQKAGQAIAQAAKKIAAQVAQFAAKAAAQAVAALAPYWFPILCIVIAVILIIVGVIMLIRAFQTPNAMGSSPVQAADILDDHALIKSILALSDVAEFQKMLGENKSKLLTDIESFEAEIKSKFPGDSRLQPTVEKLTKAKDLISKYTKPDEAQAKEIKTLIVDAIKPWLVDLNPNGLILPLGKGYSKKNISAPYLQKRKTHIHRGIDIGVPIGRPYYAAATGVIVYIFDSLRDNIDMGYGANGGFGNAIVVQTTEGPWKGYLWEIHHVKTGSMSTLGLKKGDTVFQGQLIGQSGHNGASSKPHLHFQVNKPGGECERWNKVLGRPCGVTNNTIDPNIPLGWVECPKGLPCNP